MELVHLAPLKQIAMDLSALGELLVQLKFCQKNPVQPGTTERFCNLVFQMNSYCWCEGENPNHLNGCDDGFVFFGDSSNQMIWVSWYVSTNHNNCFSSSYTSRAITLDEWKVIYQKCLDSLGPSSVPSFVGIVPLPKMEVKSAAA